MFTGITQGLFPVVSIKKQTGLLTYTIQLNELMTEQLKIGASVAIDGVCQSVIAIKNNHQVSFQAIQETLDKTTLSCLNEQSQVSVERSVKIGDEIGGHIVSGHVHGTAKIVDKKQTDNNLELTFQCPREWMKYILNKGFIAVDGSSLTVVNTDANGRFSVCLIPETLKLTNFFKKNIEDNVNIELDQQTITIVKTVERILTKQ
ncbi:MAG: riboflavin synthase subunit alpha [Gammaproteobacteria bacterium RIFCSPHIGHO2_12_FULL_41_15]|nr:MAG: riboflavin synthase subunit alpha [Gammaproteobacteria bacterium RIFCSPHIGHO2_12_FULL_41_15]